MSRGGHISIFGSLDEELVEGKSVTVKKSLEIISEDEDVTETVGSELIVSKKHNTENDGFFYL